MKSNCRCELVGMLANTSVTVTWFELSILSVFPIPFAVPKYFVAMSWVMRMPFILSSVVWGPLLQRGS